MNLSSPSGTLHQQKQHVVVGIPIGKNNFLWFFLNPLPNKISFCDKPVFQRMNSVAKTGSVSPMQGGVLVFLNELLDLFRKDNSKFLIKMTKSLNILKTFSYQQFHGGVLCNAFS